MWFKQGTMRQLKSLPRKEMDTKEQCDRALLCLSFPPQAKTLDEARTVTSHEPTRAERGGQRRGGLRKVQ